MVETVEDEYAWELGDDYYCDTCGYTYNEISLEKWDEETNIWQLHIRVGCYSGRGVISEDPEWGTKTATIIEEALMYPNFTEEEAASLTTKLNLIGGSVK